MAPLLANTLVVVYCVAFIRALSWPAAWLARKPLSCNACMAGWVSIAGFLMGWEVTEALAAAGGAVLGLTWMNTTGSSLWSPPTQE